MYTGLTSILTCIQKRKKQCKTTYQAQKLGIRFTNEKYEYFTPRLFLSLTISTEFPSVSKYPSSVLFLSVQTKSWILFLSFVQFTSLSNVIVASE